jgi:hypothetical protein
MSHIILASSHATYPMSFLAYAFAKQEHHVTLVVPFRPSYEHGDHSTCLAEARQDASISVQDMDGANAPSCDLVFVMVTSAASYTREQYAYLVRLLELAPTVAVVAHNWMTGVVGNLRSSIRCHRYYPAIARRATAAAVEYRLPRMRTPFLLHRRFMIGEGPHPRYFHDTKARNLLAAPWEPTASRPLLGNFLGTLVPRAREKALDVVVDALKNCGREVVEDTCNRSVDHHKPVFLRAVGREWGKPRPKDEYLRILRSSDFTLCVPGSTLWSCRPYEAFMTGSIPVLLEEEVRDCLDVPVRDGIDAVVVRKGNWREAVSRICRLSEEEVVAMRTEIARQSETALSLQAWAQRLYEKAWRSVEGARTMPLSQR